jgi:allose kinase
MDIGGTNLRSGFVDAANQLDGFRVEKSSAVFASADSAKSLVDYIGSLLEGREKPGAISMGVPSTVDRNNRVVFSTPNLKGLDNVDVASLLEDQFGIPAFVSRDVCLLLLYDIQNNNLKKEGFILGFYIGTGTGNAISVNGEIMVGKNGVAGELGHIPVIGKNELCGCGNRGCIELYASGKYLAEIKKNHFPDDSIGDILTRHADDPLIESFIDNVAIAIATEINIFDPEKIILGGGVIMQSGFPKDKLEEAIKLHARKPYPAENLEFIYAKDSGESGVIGAAIFGFQKIRRAAKESI